MPAHIRRHKQSRNGARLQSNRLPLGTPELPSRSQTTSRATNRSTSAGSSHVTNPSDNIPDHSESNDHDMADSTQPTMSLADAKLQRQNERCQLADAALANPPQQRSRPQSRAKTRLLNSSDDPLYQGRSRATSTSDGGVPIETRVNSYRSESTRPPHTITTFSPDNSTTVAAESVEMKRQDSAVDDVGFQTYTGRRNSRKVDLGAYEEKPEVKQTTVEATVDQREILAVFANPLPGLEFLAGQAGWREGQVQFIQHPNGDVSAHMWSAKSYQWDNIGQFSNIRKKIEGQLAGDHLKGETASQKLQKNSLAYFRTIAKQREAVKTGTEFGQAEIQQLLPDPDQSEDAASSSNMLENSTPVLSQGAHGQRKDGPHDSQDDVSQQHRIVSQPTEPLATHPFYAIPQGSHIVDDRVRESLSPRQVRHADDPFTANAFVPSFARLGQDYHGGTVAGPARQSTSMGPPQSVDIRSAGNRPYNQIPLPAIPDVSMPYKPLPAVRTSSEEEVGRNFGSSLLNRPSLRGMPPIMPARVAGTGPETDRRHPSVASLESLRGKPVTPLQAREAMRENLFKISDHAVERSLSRENLQNLSAAAVEREQSRPTRRTVLHDPFQSDPRTEFENYTSQSTPYRTASEDYGNIGRMPLNAASYHTTGIPHGWQDSQPRKTPLIESHLSNSVPDTIDGNYSVPFNRGYSNSYDFNSDPRTSCSTLSSAKELAVTPEQQLQDWWTSGSKFARQEEFFQGVRAAPGCIGPNETVATSRGAAASEAEAFANGDVLTRILIPVYENLSTYLMPPPPSHHQQYWHRPFAQPREWCIDRGPNGNKSFYDDPCQSSASISRDSRYSSSSGGARFAGVAVPASLERRLRDTQF